MMRKSLGRSGQLKWDFEIYLRIEKINLKRVKNDCRKKSRETLQIMALRWKAVQLS